jgi:hypothetical protein
MTGKGKQMPVRKGTKIYENSLKSAKKKKQL